MNSMETSYADVLVMELSGPSRDMDVELEQFTTQNSGQKCHIQALRIALVLLSVGVQVERGELRGAGKGLVQLHRAVVMQKTWD